MKIRESRQIVVKAIDYLVTPCPDGLVRLTVEQLSALTFEHIISGLDSVSAVDFESERASFSGYTEWLFENRCAITLGWDWHWLWRDGQMTCCVKALPRSNIQLLEQGLDVSPRRNDELLITVINLLPWQKITAEAISKRYRESPMKLR
ncbi:MULTISPECIES: DUF4902 domain-containing protein [unclassified Agarivorans]|uniref:DUF4902 domain-containing protein n=1 Tax=unclassified Agarivorans TaxID=2636026 RepID=UPI003D7DACD9